MPRGKTGFSLSVPLETLPSKISKNSSAAVEKLCFSEGKLIFLLDPLANLGIWHRFCPADALGIPLGQGSRRLQDC